MTKEEIKDELYRMLSDVVNGSCPIRNNTQRGRYREAVKEAIEVLEIFDIYADTAYECGKHANQRTGQWIITNRNGVNMYVCSECNNEPLLIGESYPIFKLSDYCPYCGIKMEVNE